MNDQLRGITLYGGLAALLLTLAAPVRAQDSPPPQPPAENGEREETSAEPVPALPGAEDAKELPPAVLTLRSLMLSLDLLRNEIEAKQAAYKKAATPEEQSLIAHELTGLNEKLQTMEQDFQSIATGIDLERFLGQPDDSLDLNRELDQLFSPILQELKEITREPREIEEMRNELELYEQRRETVNLALENVQRLREMAVDETLKEELSGVEEQWKERLQEIESRIQVTDYRLKQSLDGRDSFFDSVTNTVTSFFRSRGRNLLLSILTFFVVFLLLRYLHRYLYKVSPWHKPGKKGFYFRLVDVLYYAFTFLGALVASLLVLYATGDWVLMGLAIIFLVGLILAAKNGLPRFYNQARLLLNVGEVREGERILKDGIPYRVESLSFYSRLRNPLLTGGELRIPLGQLIGQVSRPLGEHELWFPCEEGDWVILADGTRGKVILQTPEMVQLILLGGSRKSYATGDFYGQSPDNLSHNFRIKSVFGVDYQHQAICTTEIPDLLWKKITAGLYGVLQEREQLISLKVEFQEAGSSSLNYEILADFRGDVADKYEMLRRALQRLAVDACNENGWVIPFTQVTLHPPPGSEDGATFGFASRNPSPSRPRRTVVNKKEKGAKTESRKEDSGEE